MTRGGIHAETIGRSEFETVVELALAELPDDVASKIDNLVVVVEDKDPSGEGLLGLYEGVPLLERGFEYQGALPDRITIFIDSHFEMGLDRNALADEIRRTVLHEIGHHLGIDDRRLHALGWA